MNVVIARRLLPFVAFATLGVAATGCGDDGGEASTASSAPAAESTTSDVATSAPAAVTIAPDGTDPAATEPAAADPAATSPAGTEAVVDRPTTTPAAGSPTTDTLPPTTLPAPTTIAPPATDAPPTTSPPAPSTTAAPIVIGGLTLATCIASEYFGFDAVEPRAEVALYQFTLRNLGYDPGDIDGYFGPMTLEAGANEIIDHTTDNAGLFIDEGVIHEEAFIRLGIAC